MKRYSNILFLKFSNKNVEHLGYVSYCFLGHWLLFSNWKFVIYDYQGSISYY
jgi:hypothetical protein